MSAEPVQDRPEAVGPHPHHPAALYLTVVVFGWLGGLAAWIIFQTYYPVFGIPDEITKAIRPFASAEELRPFHEAAAKADLRNLAFFFGLFGALLSAALGIGDGIVRRSFRKALAQGTVCAAVGAVAGCAAGLLGH